MAEGNKGIITLTGHCLREAATAEEEGPLPEAIERGLAQLSGIEASIPIAPTGARPPEPKESPPPRRPIGRCSSELARSR